MKDGTYKNIWHDSIIKVQGDLFFGIKGIMNHGEVCMLRESYWKRVYKFNEYLKLL